MARLAKRDHARILEMVDVEQRKVSEVATEYGCSPANIYTLLGKLRRTARAAAEPAQAEPPAEPVPPAPADLFASAKPDTVIVEPACPAQPAVSATVTELPRKAQPVSKRGGIGASLAKPGYGLTMRTGDGDENVTPFRSLEDLLSAIKPILRASARNPDPVWFSIQQIDLSTIEFDAA